MRVLITRAEPDAVVTAATVVALGYEPIVAPLSWIEVAPQPAVTPACDVVLATSLNALRCADLAPLLPHAGFAVVGARSADHVKALGGRLFCAPAAGAADLVRRVIAGTPREARLLYLAGEPRKSALEDALRAAGYDMTVLVVYSVVAARHLPPEVASALATGHIDVVLHYSREGAARFSRLAAGVRAADKPLRHVCLSADVAAGLGPGEGDDIRVAAHPDEASLLAVLEVFR
ncbi:MAG: uroporphyrinogen-III synthase [Proteobacteria bacterium]|nr:uroporphyrinogen-III synthase [Pseudomonadota bacterium]